MSAGHDLRVKKKLLDLVFIEIGLVGGNKEACADQIYGCSEDLRAIESNEAHNNSPQTWRSNLFRKRVFSKLASGCAHMVIIRTRYEFGFQEQGSESMHESDLSGCK